MANYMASGVQRLGRHREAADLLDQAEAGFRATGDDAAADRTLSNISAVRWLLGDLDAAERAGLRSLAGARRRQHLEAIPAAVTELGNIATTRGDLTTAVSWYRRELLIAVELRSDFLRMMSFSNLARARLGLGHRPAERMVRLAIVLSRRLGYRSTVIEGRSALGAHLRGQGRITEALAQHRMALAVADELDEKRLRATARTEFGLTLLAAGDRAAAIPVLHDAAELAAAAEVRHEEARSRAALARAVAADDPAAARRHARHALAVFRDMGVPEQSGLERWLADL